MQLTLGLQSRRSSRTASPVYTPITDLSFDTDETTSVAPPKKADGKRKRIQKHPVPTPISAKQALVDSEVACEIDKIYDVSNAAKKTQAV